MSEKNIMIVDTVEALEKRIEEVREAQRIFSTYSQEQVDKIFAAAALAANKARIPLAKQAVAETGMGIVEDKVIKNHYASEYIYNAYKDTKTCGVIEEDSAYGIKRIAEPIGVVAAVIPTTNPTSTAIFKTLICLKTRNGIIISPHPRAKESTIAAAKVVLEAAVAAAKEKGKEGWLFTLHAPSYGPFLKYADNRDLREKMYRAYNSRCNRANDRNNGEIIRQITALQLEKAKIMGYPTYADYALTNRMASSPAEVNTFLQQLLEASHSQALKEKKEVEEFARKNGFTGKLQRWDWAYYSNKLKQEKYALDDEMLKPYFKLENVQRGVFDLANTLYGLTFKEVNNIPKYHEDVQTFEVYDRDGSFLSVLYTDFFPRASKSGGAWMTEFLSQHVRDGKDVRPQVSLVMNFSKPTATKPSLLTFDEVTTLLHEFGHSLHGMLSRNTYNGTGGTNVYRDFVELPSQIMENWALEKEWLDKWAVHYETGEKIPQEYIEKIRKSANFLSGYLSDRQLSFGMVDMAWHTITAPVTDSIVDFERKAMQPTEIFPDVEGTCFSTAFGHIFGGGYAAGYYSYKWAEVLDADAFSVFKKNGIFDAATAEAFRKNILEKGGSEHPMTLYVRFRGQKPTVDALLERSGLK
jgi:peptidyl-dipeptidase Dcp